MIFIGHKRVPVSGRFKNCYRALDVWLTYVRQGEDIMVLEGWINPTMASGLDHIDRMDLIRQASTRCIDAVKIQVRNFPDHERTWKGVQYG